ncbi:hypothetical protein AAMO2058_000419900 [Amorphochlora amoebiformis]
MWVRYASMRQLEICKSVNIDIYMDECMCTYKYVAGSGMLLFETKGGTKTKMNQLKPKPKPERKLFTSPFPFQTQEKKLTPSSLSPWYHVLYALLPPPFLPVSVSRRIKRTLSHALGG